MELYTQAFVIKVGYALLTSICPAGEAADTGACIRSSDWINDAELTAEGMATCTRIGEARRRLVKDGVAYSFECRPYAGGARYGDPSAVVKADGEIDISEVGAPTDMPDLPY